MGTILFLLSAVLSSHSATAEANVPAMAKSEKLVVYTTNSWHPEELCVEVAAIVSVSSDTPLQGKVQHLADMLSRKIFDGNTIKVARIEEKDGKQIAVIDLQEGANAKNGWRSDFFQGSTGGAITGISLTRTFRQDGFDGEWPDGFYFLYEGKPINENDVEHAPELCETHYRATPLYSVGMETDFRSSVPVPRRMLLTWNSMKLYLCELHDFEDFAVYPQMNWQPICKVEITEASGNRSQPIETIFILTIDRMRTKSFWKTDIVLRDLTAPCEAHVTLFESDTLHAAEWYPGSEHYRVLHENHIMEKKSERIEKPVRAK